MEECPIAFDPPEATAASSRTFDWFSAAAIGTWIVCGIWPFSRMLAGGFPRRPAIAYVVMFAVYGAAAMVMQFLPKRRTPVPRALPVTLAGIETATGIAMNAITAWFIHGTGVGIGLLVIVAAQLPYFVTPRVVWSWITAQTVVLSGIFLPAYPQEAIITGLAFGGFELFAAASSFLAISEGRARGNLARANAELQATRSLLAESSRAEERLRIARDLHDTIGHHLTALGLQLDVASRLSQGQAAEHLQQAHAITRLLLSDVRDVVSRTRDTGPLDVASALRTVAGATAGVAVRLDVPETLDVPDPAQADALVKALQEVITNTVRHARATTLDVRVARDGDRVVLVARDNGVGAWQLAWGHGLRGMRERFQQFGGTLDARNAGAGGFEITAEMPLRSAR